MVFALLFALAMLSPSGMGFGDVKLGALIALFSGWIGYAAAAMAIAAGFVVGALVALGLVLSRRRGLRDAIPMGPALLVGAWLVMVTR